MYGQVLTPLDIEAIFKNESLSPDNSGVGGGGSTPSAPLSPSAPPEDLVSHRTSQLQPVLDTAKQLWFAGSPDIDNVAQKLGDGGRDASWRIPLGQSGILDFFLRIIAVEGLRTALKQHTLRLIGNSCADTDENRDKVIASGHLPAIIRLVNDDSILTYVVPVLFNVCVDYEPAQNAVYNAGLALQLYNLIAGPRYTQCGPVINLIAQILGFFSAKDPNPQLADPLTPLQLLHYTSGPLPGNDLERFVTITSAALSYLVLPGNQSHFLSINGLPYLLGVYEAACRHWIPDPANDPDIASQHSGMKSAFLTVMSDISGLDNFPYMAQLHPEVQSACLGFLSSSIPDLQTAACLILGNLARSDGPAVSLVKDFAVHQTATNILVSPANAPNKVLLHAALGLLKNLAVPSTNKSTIGPHLLAVPNAPLPRFWALDTLPEVQFQAVSLTRSLCTGCSSNVRILLAPLSPDPASPAHNKSKLSVLLDLFSRSDAEPTRVESARCVLAVCRVLHSTPILEPDWPTPESVEVLAMRASHPNDRVPKTITGPAPSSSSTPCSTGTPSTLPETAGTTPMAAAAAAATSFNPAPPGSMPPPPKPGAKPDTPTLENRPSPVREHFYACHPETAHALTTLAGQSKWPALRSECWFVFALMARSQEGANIVMATLMEVEPASALIETMAGVSASGTEEGRGLADMVAGGASGHSNGTAVAGGNSNDVGGEDPSTEHATEKDEQISHESTAPPLPTTAATGSEEQASSAAASLGLDPQILQGQGQTPADSRNKENMARVDRENTIVVVSELLKNCHNMPPMRRHGFGMLLRQAGEIVSGSGAAQVAVTGAGGAMGRAGGA